MGRWFRIVHDEMLLRERSTEETDSGNVKSRVVFSGLSVMASMLFPRIERCSRAWISASGRRADNDLISLLSRVNFVMAPGRERDMVRSWLPDAVSDVNDGKRDVTSTIYLNC